MQLHDMLPELRTQCLTRPDSFAMFDRSRPWFEPNGWGFTPIGTHRDADTLTRSNWEVITRDLIARFPDAFQTLRTSHWAVGWYDHLAVDTANEDAMLALAEWVAALSDYPVASEDHFSELEWNEACAAWEAMSVRDRVEALKRSRARCSTFAARRAELPDDSGLHDYLVTP